MALKNVYYFQIGLSPHKASTFAVFWL